MFTIRLFPAILARSSPWSLTQDRYEMAPSYSPPPASSPRWRSGFANQHGPGERPGRRNRQCVSTIHQGGANTSGNLFEMSLCGFCYSADYQITCPPKSSWVLLVDLWVEAAQDGLNSPWGMPGSCRAPNTDLCWFPCTIRGKVISPTRPKAE